MRSLRVALAVGTGLAVVAGLAAVALLTALRPPRVLVPAVEPRIFRDVTLVEAGRPPRPGSTLRVGDGRIEAIVSGAAAASARTSHEGAAEAPDLSGLFVAPGLIDLHVHYPPAVAIGNAELWSLLLLAHGVTAVRETGSIDGSVFGVREAIQAGRTPGPRIFTCGAMLDGVPPSFPSNRVVETPAAGRAAVREQATLGADCIKAYNMLAPEVLASIRESAAQVGLPVIGHAPHSVALEDAGLSDLQHGTGAVRVDPATVGRRDFLDGDWRSVDDARIAHVAEVSLEQDIAHTPTLVNARLRRLLTDATLADEVVGRDTGLRHLPRFWHGVWESLWGPPFTPGTPSEASNDFFRARQRALTAGLHAAGVRIHAGTDTLMPFVAPGSSLHGELAELMGAGIPPERVWQIATRENARALGEPGLGTLAVGAPADLVFLRANPAHGIEALLRIEAVLADGRLYRRADLDAALARLDAHFLGPLYESVMGGIVALMQGGFAPERDAVQTH